jgi:hypothetical protein
MQLPRVGDALAAAFSPDGTKIVVGYSDGTARVWQIGAHAGVAIRSLQVDPSGKLTAVDAEGAMIEGRIENNRLAGLAFTDIDSRLALGPAVVWRSAGKADVGPGGDLQDPSFNCAVAASADEKAIYSNPSLRKLEVSVSEAYRLRIRSGALPRQLRDNLMVLPDVMIAARMSGALQRCWTRNTSF